MTLRDLSSWNNFSLKTESSKSLFWPVNFQIEFHVFGDYVSFFLLVMATRHHVDLQPVYTLHNREKGTELGTIHNQVFMSRDLGG